MRAVAGAVATSLGTCLQKANRKKKKQKKTPFGQSAGKKYTILPPLFLLNNLTKQKTSFFFFAFAGQQKAKRAPETKLQTTHSNITADDEDEARGRYTPSATPADARLLRGKTSIYFLPSTLYCFHIHLRPGALSINPEGSPQPTRLHVSSSQNKQMPRYHVERGDVL